MKSAIRNTLFTTAKLNGYMIFNSYIYEQNYNIDSNNNPLEIYNTLILNSIPKL